MIEIYTDGSLRGAAQGGYGVIALTQNEGETAILYAYQEQIKNVTNNQMELMAVIHACEVADNRYPYEEVIIYSDSYYCVAAINKWMRTWAANGWVTAKNEPVKNIDLMKKLYRLFSQNFYHCSIEWRKGHNDNLGNELADSLAAQNKPKFLKLINENHIKVPSLDFL